jgi:signal peptidase I
MANVKKNDGGAGAAPVAYRKSTVREYVESICIAVVLALFVRTYVVQAFKIPTGSMENNLLIGDHLLVNKFVFAPTRTALERMLLPIDPIRRGDILVFKFPQDPDRDFIKRVIGLPGETLEMREKKIYINGKPLDEPYVHFLYPIEGRKPGEADFTEAAVMRNYGPVTVPEGYYFMMGDNRDNSQDSRYWGFLTRDYIKGKALFIYLSLNEDVDWWRGVRWSRLLHQIH